MGPPKSGIIIELDNPARSYFAGQVIQGRVIVQNDKPKTAKEVTLLLEGNGRVQWSETQSYTVVTHTTHNNHHNHNHNTPRHITKTRTVFFKSEEKYVHLKLSLAGDGHNSMTIPEGRNIYPFQLVLPTNLPSSFTSKTGLVSYFLEAELRRPFLKPNKKNAVPFTVNGIFDLNLELGAVQAQEITKIKGSNFFACRKGQMGFVLKLQRSGFVSGELIDFNCEMTNSSSRKVNSVKASIIQTTNFYAQGKSRTMEKSVCELEGPAVDCGDHEMWCPRNFQIPSLPPSRLGGNCRIIDVAYFFRLDMHVSGLSSSLTATLPIMIGTIPLRNTFDTLRQPPLNNAVIGFQVPGPSSALERPPQPQPPQIQEKSGYFHDTILNESTTGIPSAPPFMEYPDLPPPTYAEAVMSETFTWERVEENDEHNSKQGFSSGNNIAQSSSTSMPSAPPMYEFVPNYITYQKY